MFIRMDGKPMIQQEQRNICLPFAIIISAFLLGCISSWPEEGAGNKIVDPIPKLDTYSLEGLPVSFHPSPGKLLLVQFWKPEDPKSIEFNKETLLLYRRFHEKGLEALSVCCDASEEFAAQTAQRWKIDWPQVLDGETQPPITQQFGVISFPCRYLIDEQGKILLNNPQGEEAHAQIAQCLKVSLDSLPIPDTPQAQVLPESDRAMIESPPPQRGGTLIIRDKDASDPRLLFGSPEERKEAEEAIEILRKVNLALTRYRMKNNDKMPDWLSDLYPDCLADNVLLICPSNPTPLRKYGALGDRNVPTCFTYEFAPVTVDGIDNRQQKIAYLTRFGDRVPVVRCFNFNRPLCLTYGGEIFFMDDDWQKTLPSGKTLNDLEAKVRRQLMTIAAAIDQYRIDKNDIPVVLEDLIPDYLNDESILINPATDKPFSYQFTPDKKNTMGVPYDIWKREQLGEFGGIVPIVRAEGVLENEQVIDLSYGGEIWSSQSEWEKDVVQPVSITSPIISFIEIGNENREIQARGWPQTHLLTESPIDVPERMAPLRGEWIFERETKLLRMPDPNTAPGDILFSPFVNQGEIELNARVSEGSGGIYILFGYTSPDRFFLISLQGFPDAMLSTQNWNNLDGFYKSSAASVRFSFPRNEWHNIRVVVDDTTRMVRCFIDGKLQLSDRCETRVSGRFGAATWNTSAEFKDIVIRPMYPAQITEEKSSPSLPPATPPAANGNPKAPKAAAQFNKIGIVAQWDEKANQGYRIFAVTWNSPAFNANLKSDDLIAAVNGTELRQNDAPESSREKAEEILKNQGDLPWALGVIRNGKDAREEITIQPLAIPTPDNSNQGIGQYGGQYGMGRMGGMGFGGYGVGPQGMTPPLPKVTIPVEWTDTPLIGSQKIEGTTPTLPLRGIWNFDGAEILQRDITNPGIMIFSPWIEKGEIRLKVKIDGGKEGVRLMMGYTFPHLSQRVWSISADPNTFSFLELWENYGNQRYPQGQRSLECNLQPNQWYDIRLSIDSEREFVKGYIDNKLALNEKANNLAGRFGVGTWNTTASFKEIEILGESSESGAAAGDAVDAATP